MPGSPPPSPAQLPMNYCNGSHRLSFFEVCAKRSAGRNTASRISFFIDVLSIVCDYDIFFFVDSISTSRAKDIKIKQNKIAEHQIPNLIRRTELISHISHPKSKCPCTNILFFLLCIFFPEK